MTFRLDLPLEIELPGAELCTSLPVRVRLTYQAGRWKGQCTEPPVSTVLCDTLEQALVAVTREITRDAELCNSR